MRKLSNFFFMLSRIILRDFCKLKRVINSREIFYNWIGRYSTLNTKSTIILYDTSILYLSYKIRKNNTLYFKYIIISYLSIFYFTTNFKNIIWSNYHRFLLCITNNAWFFYNCIISYLNFSSFRNNLDLRSNTNTFS